MDWRMILFWVLALAFGALALNLAKGSGEANNHSLIRNMTVDAVFVAIIFAMGFIPNFGYITIAPGISLTLIHIPVLLGCYLFGPKRGLIYGLAFGVTSWIQANINPVGFNFFFVVPWVSVLPRLIFSFVSGLLFTLVKKKHKIYIGAFKAGLLSFGLTLLHTLLVFGSLYIFYFDDISALMSSQTSGYIVGTVAGIIAIGALGESILSSIIVPMVGKATNGIVSKKRRKANG